MSRHLCLSAGSLFKLGMSGVCPDRYACVLGGREREARVGKSRFLRRRQERWDQDKKKTEVRN